MKNKGFLIVTVIAVLVICAVIGYCTWKSEPKVDIVNDGAASVVPDRDTLIENLSDCGYRLSEFDDVYGLSVDGQRVFAEKGDRFIDICYGLNAEDAETAFSFFEEKYGNADYYILAINDTFVYCVSDKQTFQDSGFKSTANIGTQYINE